MNTIQLRQWLAEGKTDRILEGLLQVQPPIDPDLQHEVTLISARFESLGRQKRAGMLEFKDETRERSAINDALLEIIKRLEKQPKRGFFAAPWKKWGSILIVSAGVLGGLAEFTGFSLRDFFGKKPDPSSLIQPDSTGSNPGEQASTTPPKSQPTTQSTPAIPAENRASETKTPIPDTTLSIACKTNKGSLNLHFKSGETMRFYVKVSQPCTLRSIYKLADGRLVLFDTDRRVTAAEVKQWLEIGPGFETAEPFGEERLFVFAQSAEFPPLSVQKDADGYLFITDGLPEALRKTRGFKKKQRFAEDALQLTTHL